mmetsp:Transcript_115461/g.337706  ORF Transcript_115461/g.337706 Transcript_115461/m.337706 type:complete len:364 (+) Transcript_115461:61-1152(+)
MGTAVAAAASHHDPTPTSAKKASNALPQRLLGSLVSVLTARRLAGCTSARATSTFSLSSSHMPKELGSTPRRPPISCAASCVTPLLPQPTTSAAHLPMANVEARMYMPSSALCPQASLPMCKVSASLGSSFELSGSNMMYSGVAFSLRVRTRSASGENTCQSSDMMNIEVMGPLVPSSHGSSAPAKVPSESLRLPSSKASRSSADCLPPTKSLYLSVLRMWMRVTGPFEATSGSCVRRSTPLMASRRALFGRKATLRRSARNIPNRWAASNCMGPGLNSDSASSRREAKELGAGVVSSWRSSRPVLCHLTAPAATISSQICCDRSRNQAGSEVILKVLRSSCSEGRGSLLAKKSAVQPVKGSK